MLISAFAPFLRPPVPASRAVTSQITAQLWILPSTMFFQPVSRLHQGRVRSAARASSRSARTAKAAMALSALALASGKLDLEFLIVGLERRVVSLEGVHEGGVCLLPSRR